MVVQLAVAARQLKAVDGMHQPPLSHCVKALGIHQHPDLHRDIQPVAAALQLLAHAFAFPGVPVGDMVEQILTVVRPQEAGLCQLPALTAAAAAQRGAPALHLSLGFAVGALVQHPVQPVGAKALGDGHAPLLLGAEVVKAEFPLQNGVELLGAHSGDLLG